MKIHIHSVGTPTMFAVLSKKEVREKYLHLYWGECFHSKRFHKTFESRYSGGVFVLPFCVKLNKV
jgi:hypothetical protein